MSYAQAPRPRKVKPNIVKGFVRGRPARPIQGILSPRPVRTARVRTNGLGDYDTYLALSKAMNVKRAMTPQQHARMMGQLENHSDYEYGMGDGDNTGYGAEQTDSGLDFEYVIASDGGIGAVPVKVRKVPAKPAQMGMFGLKRQMGESEDYEYVDAGYGSLGDDYSDSGGMGNWFTDILNVGPKIYVPGVTTAPPPDAYNTWRAQVIARGHTVARWPTGPQAGELAEMTVRAADGVKLYGNAPAAVIEEDHKITAFNQQAAATANIPEKILEKAGSVVGAAGAAGRKAVGDTLGIPQWLFPVLIIGGGYIALKSVLPRMA